MNDELHRACEALGRIGADVAVLGSVANVTYVTNIEVPIPFGASAEMTYAPWLAVISVQERRGWAVVPDFAVEKFRAGSEGFEALGFDTFDSFNASDPRGTYLVQVETALNEAGLPNEGTLALESRAAPALALQRIADRAWPPQVIEAERALAEARWIKTEREIGLLRHASHLSDIGQNSLAALCREAGKHEIAMWAAISSNIFLEEGHDIMLSGELVTGPRSTTVLYPNGPRDRRTEPGDAALMDLSGRANGYWFDCTNTHVVGAEPTKEQLKYARASQDACEAAMAALKPGAKASDAARAAEQAFAKHGLPMAHYAGHQIGVTVNEFPRLVPYDDSIIQAGMVFSVEPGVYQGPDGDFGARSEKMVLVREDGPEVLSRFEWGI
jgi:Xaa-Pro aminopeptidase